MRTELNILRGEEVLRSVEREKALKNYLEELGIPVFSITHTKVLGESYQILSVTLDDEASFKKYLDIIDYKYSLTKLDFQIDEEHHTVVSTKTSTKRAIKQIVESYENL